MRVYGVIDRQLPPGNNVIGDFVDTFLRREDAARFLADCLHDEPEWADVLSVGRKFR